MAITYDIDYFKKELSKWISKDRYKHSLNVSESAVELAQCWNADVEKCKIAGLLHDCGKLVKFDDILKMCERYDVTLSEMDLQSPKTIHALLGEVVANRIYGIEDEEILHAIKCHTTGEANMSLIDKIIFLADVIEPGRPYNEAAKVRKIAFENVDKAMQMAYDNSIECIVSKGDVIHLSTVIGRNDIVLKLKNKKEKMND